MNGLLIYLLLENCWCNGRACQVSHPLTIQRRLLKFCVGKAKYGTSGSPRSPLPHFDARMRSTPSQPYKSNIPLSALSLRTRKLPS